MSRLISIDISPIDVDNDIVSVDEARFHAALGDNFSYDLVKAFIATARMKIERYTGIVMIPSIVTSLYRQQGYGDCISLSYCNNISGTVTGLPSGTALKGSGYQLYIDTTEKEVSLTYTAGFAVVPDIFKQAALKQIAWDTMHFGDESVSDYCPEMKLLLSQFRSHIWE